MMSSRHVAGLTRQLSLLWRTSTEHSAVCLPVTRAGYLQRRCIVTSQTGWNSQKEGRQSTGPSEEAKRRAKNFQIATGAACAFFGASYILYRQVTVRAAEATATQVAGLPSQEDSQDGEESKEEEDEPKKKHVSLHDKHVIGYEDRIRAYSTPDKIFRYFATLQIKEEDGSIQIYMTPDDFLRSITPGKIQPAGLGLDKFLKMTVEKWKAEYSQMKINPGSVFARLGHHGLISFTDYLFLLTLLATPTHHFEIAFKMFDLNGDGEVDVEEFETVRDVVLNSTSVGHRHRDRSTTGNVAGSVDNALVEYFFGPNKDRRLTADKFREFHEQLLLEILRLEFNNYHHVNGCICEYDFAKLILSYSSMNSQAKKKYMKRIRKRFGKVHSDCPDTEGGIAFEDLRAFTQLVESISDVEMALGMYMAAGASITAADLKSVSKAVAGVDLGDHLVEVIIALFDEDGDGNLSYKEFIKTVKSRTTRGLERPKELGFARLISAVMACSEKMGKEALGIKT